jgi:hypothetical protein
MTVPRPLLAALVVLVASVAPSACASAGGSTSRSTSDAPGSSHGSSSSSRASSPSVPGTTGPRPVVRPRSTAPDDRYPPALTARWQTITRIGGRPALWIAQRSGVTLVRMDQHLVHLALHAGSVDPGGSGWHYGDRIAGREIHRLILGMNGGFKFNVDAGGFESLGRTAVTLTPGLGSIVTYTDGTTDVGSWDATVPAPGRPIASVRQNLHLLIDNGVPASSVSSCGATCWGATVGGASAVARSAMGVRADGQLLWAAGEDLTVSQLAGAMSAAGVQRAVELDINPDWVAGYLYVHHRIGAPAPIPVVPGQYGIYGHLLTPYSRDFFTVLAN